jgi:transcriptional regulator with XRE-family HTH domain
MISGQVPTKSDMNRKIKKKRLKSSPNNLREIRTSEGLKITELSALARVSTKTIAGVEYRSRSVSLEMKHKIVNGLNHNAERQKEYSFSDVFPNDQPLPNNAKR